MRTGVEGCGVVVWFGQYTEIAFLVSLFFLFVSSRPAYIYPYIYGHTYTSTYMHGRHLAFICGSWHIFNIEIPIVRGGSNATIAATWSRSHFQIGFGLAIPVPVLYLVLQNNI